ncbi:hypothetical protein So717_14790 [Roseobacter cerasinus]|uniref:DUF309 domain-containing protein n=1 Tax=Roseobacter cerasinus TaxID=2602289 RepID=A0A640VU26_9RHOB|nr:DUF309 domain-containing protein [Roseobacter cerasinus]GFE49726.1 hypothetical protein So717_14790 [Roseobacter cerasinus]
MLRWPDLPEDLRPSHAYVPGQTARHPEDWFESIKATVGTSPDRLWDTSAFQTGLAYLGAGYFWECHEVLEAVWLHTADPSAEREMVQALIQLANARLKLQMQRPRAARRLCAMVQGHLAGCGGEAEVLGLRVRDVQEEVAATLKRVDMRDIA